MDILYWIIIITAFLIAFIGLVYPVIPVALFLAVGFVLYGVFFSFDPFTISFWIVEGILMLFLFLSDYIANWLGVERSGGSKYAVRGSIAGLIIGPFLLPPFGIIIGPLAGAFLAEWLLNKSSVKMAFKVALAALAAFLAGAAMKAVVMVFMIGYFLWIVR
ncbi:DUF456 domain-containing protein [Bacillus marinisedimentorum]|uniref:DUF456 domain-containing protein n=1 Tax=Bacillus marinisedimentorum TaxID=1821260 RepID=UPI0008730392|nr:DUF456 family protein [Bacillus marinisedimentorum]